jgi:hypothetical protein
MISDFDIADTFETALQEKTSEFGVGYFTAELDRDEKGMKIVLRVAAMVDTAGEEDFKTNPELSNVIVEFPEGKVLYQVEETVSVSGMEIEVIYRPKAFKPTENA